MTEICDKGPKADCDQTCNRCLKEAKQIANKIIARQGLKTGALLNAKHCSICRQVHSGICTAHSGDRVTKKRRKKQRRDEGRGKRGYAK